MNQITLELATEADFGTIINIEKQLISKTYVPLGNSDELKKILNKGSIYLIKKDQDIAGLVAYYETEDGSIYIDTLAIDPKYQSQGIGREALKQTLEKIGKTKKIWLVTHPENQAKNLYESLGFKIATKKENYFGDGEPRLILIFENH